MSSRRLRGPTRGDLPLLNRGGGREILNSDGVGVTMFFYSFEVRWSRCLSTFLFFRNSVISACRYSLLLYGYACLPGLSPSSFSSFSPLLSEANGSPRLPSSSRSSSYFCHPRCPSKPAKTANAQCSPPSPSIGLRLNVSGAETECWVDSSCCVRVLSSKLRLHATIMA